MYASQETPDNYCHERRPVYRSLIRESAEYRGHFPALIYMISHMKTADTCIILSRAASLTFKNPANFTLMLKMESVPEKGGCLDTVSSFREHKEQRTVRSSTVSERVSLWGLLCIRVPSPVCRSYPSCVYMLSLRQL